MERKEKTKKKVTYLTTKQIAQIIYLYENNATFNDMVNYFKKDSTTLYRVLWKYNVKQKTFEDLLKEFDALVKEGKLPDESSLSQALDLLKIYRSKMK